MPVNKLRRKKMNSAFFMEETKKVWVEADALHIKSVLTTLVRHPPIINLHLPVADNFLHFGFGYGNFPRKLSPSLK